MNAKRLAIFNAVSLLIHIASSAIIQTKLLNVQGIGEVSDKYPSLFTPAGITFSVWSVIYVALLAFSAYHMFNAFKRNENDSANEDVKAIGYNFVMNNIATTAWLFVWSNEYLGLSVILIIVQLITLIRINRRLDIHNAERSQQSKIFTQFPLSIYFGWISIATIANISAWLTSLEWSGWGVSDMNWTITMIAIAALVTIWVINRRRNVAYGLVVAWGVYGIVLKRNAIDEELYEPIIFVAYGAIALIILACLFGFIRNLRIKRHTSQARG